jgi:uracil-DNA glycosylase family protein
MPRRDNVQGTEEPLIPANPTVESLRQAAANCRACDLWKKGTQTVFGEGSPNTSVMFVGEQPGDQEDITGHPFVGPAGRVFDEALVAAGINRAEVYVTNIVKHFNWVRAERGKRRIHKKPRYSEIKACRPWLDAEIAVTRPKVIICLGATAAQSLLGKDFSVTRHRAEFVPSPLAPYVMATVHPSSILRAPDEVSRREQKRAFIADLRVAAAQISRLRNAA